jgi:hypothetical protein
MLYIATGSKNFVLANHVVPYQLNIQLVHQFCPWSLFTSSSTFPSLGMFISLDLMLLLNILESHVNQLSSRFLGRHKACMELGKNLMHSRLQQLSYVLLCYVLIFESPPG